ncbi:MAG: metallophosphoesterase [Weeksellaceae bacterium]
MKKLSLVFILLSTFIQAQISTLRFNEQGEFKILQFTDTHHNPTSKTSFETFKTIQQVVLKEKPDFIVVTGDIITANPALEGWNQLAEVLAPFETPWTVTFGNHDEEHDLTKEHIYQILRKKPYFIGEKGEVSGVLNFAQPILSHHENKPAAVLYFIDSHDYVKNPVLGTYDWIKQDQIAWYQNTSNQFKLENQNKVLPSVMFFHIPLKEYDYVDKDPKKVGEKRENDGVASSDINSGLFAAIATQKDVMGVFVGHDHDDNYIGVYKNVALAFGNVTGADAYGSLERGGRVITLKENKFAFSTHITTPKKTDFEYFYPAGLSPIKKDTKILKAQKVTPKNSGLNYTYYEGNVEKVADIKKLKPKKKGVVSTMHIEEAEQEDHYAFQFAGYFYAPETAYYNFYIYSDDGAVLSIDDTVIVDNDGGHSARRRENKVALEKGFHKLNLDYFEDYMGQVLEVGFSSISIAEQVLDSENLFRD